jgi:endonuclease/exonuclease/phosphatase family metal-dependent hydrolase
MAANTSSGNNQSYDPGDGARLFQGLKPDVALIQEFNIGDNSPAAVRAFVDTNFGTAFSYYRETGQIPNGIISRYPIAASGSWTDPRVGNRAFAWAKLAIPGSHPLWAVSLHLLTTSSANRASEATALVDQIKATIPAADYLVIGGDLNTGSRTEPCMGTLSALVGTAAPYPDDGHGNANTSGNRSKPHDWVMVDADLAPHQVPTRIGAQSFPSGIVFDSRVYTPLSDVAPIEPSDSASSNMQHMPVVKDFLLDGQ